MTIFSVTSFGPGDPSRPQHQSQRPGTTIGEDTDGIPPVGRWFITF